MDQRFHLEWAGFAVLMAISLAKTGCSSSSGGAGTMDAGEGGASSSGGPFDGAAGSDAPSNESGTLGDGGSNPSGGDGSSASRDAAPKCGLCDMQGTLNYSYNCTQVGSAPSFVSGSGSMQMGLASTSSGCMGGNYGPYTDGMHSSSFMIVNAYTGGAPDGLVQGEHCQDLTSSKRFISTDITGTLAVMLQGSGGTPAEYRALLPEGCAWVCTDCPYGQTYPGTTWEEGTLAIGFSCVASSFLDPGGNMVSGNCGLQGTFTAPKCVSFNTCQP